MHYAISLNQNIEMGKIANAINKIVGDYLNENKTLENAVLVLSINNVVDEQSIET